MSEQRSIILVGFMGTGKSAVGGALATRLGRPFVDTDALVEAATGLPIAELFRRGGEAAFRRAETAAAREAAAATGAVVATGGGILGSDENVRVLRAAGPLVCLTARPEVILERIGPAVGRPLLAGAADPLERIRVLLAERARRYALADLLIDTSDLGVEPVVDSICSAFPFLSPGTNTSSC